MTGRHWSVVIPVKTLNAAKTRLQVPQPRAEYALAFARDCVTAALECGEVSHVAVISADRAVRRALRDTPAQWIDEGGADGLNPAVRLAAEALPVSATAVLTADLPALRPAELARALRAAARVQRAYVPDEQGTGTVLLSADSPAELRPAFGVGSAAAHAASGAVRLSGDWPGLRRDVDTEADLAAAIALGVGCHTTELTSRRASGGEVV